MKKTTNVGSTIFFVFIIILLTIFETLISYYCSRTNSLILIMLDMSVNVALKFIIFLTAVILSVTIESFRTCISDLKSAFRHPFCKKYIIGTVIVLFASQLFYFNEMFEHLRVNEEKPLRIQYEYYILLDAINNQTDSIEIKADDFTIEYHRYTIKGGRGVRSHHYTSWYATYNNYSVFLYEHPMKDYIDACKKYQKDIKIEYYPKSGIIKTIDDVALYDETGFNYLTTLLEKEDMERKVEENAVKKEEGGKNSKY